MKWKCGICINNGQNKVHFKFDTERNWDYDHTKCGHIQYVEIKSWQKISETKSVLIIFTYLEDSG